jgi:hypothetical protein
MGSLLNLSVELYCVENAEHVSIRQINYGVAVQHSIASLKQSSTV